MPSWALKGLWCAPRRAQWDFPPTGCSCASIPHGARLAQATLASPEGCGTQPQLHHASPAWKPGTCLSTPLVSKWL